MNKKGFELSINMIVMIILAAVVLVLAVVFISDWIYNVDIPYPPALPPSQSKPITITPVELDAGKDNKLTIGFLNTENAAIPDTVKPEVRCEGIEDIQVTTIGVSVPRNENVEYNLLIKVPKDTEKKDYACAIKISNTEDSFFAKVLG